MYSNQEIINCVNEIINDLNAYNFEAVRNDLRAFLEKRNQRFAHVAICEIIVNPFIEAQITKEQFLNLMDEHWEIVLRSRKLQSEKNEEKSK